MTDVRVDHVLVYDDGSISTETRYLAYGHQLTHLRDYWWFDRQTGFLMLNGLRPLRSLVPRAAQVINVEMGEYFFHLDRSTLATRTGAVVLRLTNVGQERHEAIVFRIPTGRTGADLFTGGLSFDQMTTVAQDNGAGEISLIGLEPGTYTLIDFIPAPDGRSHGQHGQTAEFVLTPHG